MQSPYQIVLTDDGCVHGCAVVRGLDGRPIVIHAQTDLPGSAAAGGFLGGLGRSLSRAAKRATSVVTNVAQGKVNVALRQAGRLATQDAAAIARNPLVNAANPLAAQATIYAAKHPDQIAAIVPGVGPVAAGVLMKMQVIAQRARTKDPAALNAMAAISRSAKAGNPKAQALSKVLNYELGRAGAVAGGWGTPDVRVWREC